MAKEDLRTHNQIRDDAVDAGACRDDGLTQCVGCGEAFSQLTLTYGVRSIRKTFEKEPRRELTYIKSGRYVEGGYLQDKRRRAFWIQERGWFCTPCSLKQGATWKGKTYTASAPAFKHTKQADQSFASPTERLYSRQGESARWPETEPCCVCMADARLDCFNCLRPVCTIHRVTHGSWYVCPDCGALEALHKIDQQWLNGSGGEVLPRIDWQVGKVATVTFGVSIRHDRLTTAGVPNPVGVRYAPQPNVVTYAHEPTPYPEAQTYSRREV